jgi:hypothetical protein
MAITLTDTLALYGSITATIAIGVELLKYLHERPRLKLEVLHGFVIFTPGPGRQQSEDTYTRLLVTNLGREPIAVAGAYLMWLKDGKLKMGMFSDALLDAKPRVLSPENPRTEYTVKEKEFDKSGLVFVGVNDGFGKTHGRWLKKGPQKRLAKLLLKETKSKKKK